MKYFSTRGSPRELTFENAVFEGLADDGGLYIPQYIPKISDKELLEWANIKEFPTLASKLFRKFIPEDQLATAELEQIVKKSYSTFETPNDATPLAKLPKANETSEKSFSQLYVLELFHGPTFAFKDVALQLLGNLFEVFLTKHNDKLGDDEKPRRVTVVGATSGDTGGAAIYGLRVKKNIDVFILHPEGRISPVQYKQMTSVLDRNVFNISVEGTFDDCQDSVKSLLGDLDFKRKYQLGVINSINWARIMAQISYYFHSYFSLLRKLGKEITIENIKNTKVQYSVPTGNFGDILAGFYAKEIGLPIHKLIIATNENDILHRFLETGSYKKNPKAGVVQTHSPAMDILVSSNFERLIWYLAFKENASLTDLPSSFEQFDSNRKSAKTASETIAKYMKDLNSTGEFKVSSKMLEFAKSIFSSSRVSNDETRDTISKYYWTPKTKFNQIPYILDPHTAVGVLTAERELIKTKEDVYTICLSTASPGKFPEVVLAAINEPSSYSQSKDAIITFNEIAPKELIELEGKPTRCTHVPTNGKKEIAISKVRQIIESVCSDIAL